MTIVRALFVLSALVLAAPAMAAEKPARHPGSDEVAAASTHACPARADRDGKLRCACASERGSARPEPVFTDAG